MTDHRQIVRRLELDLYKAEHGMGMPLDREAVIALRDQIAGYRRMALYYEAENINDRLNRMNETELASNAAHRLMDRLAEIRDAELDAITSDREEEI